MKPGGCRNQRQDAKEQQEEIRSPKVNKAIDSPFLIRFSFKFSSFVEGSFLLQSESRDWEGGASGAQR